MIFVIIIHCICIYYILSVSCHLAAQSIGWGKGTFTFIVLKFVVGQHNSTVVFVCFVHKQAVANNLNKQAMLALRKKYLLKYADKDDVKVKGKGKRAKGKSVVAKK